MSEQREMSGVLSKNTRKESEKQPDYRGTATVKGVAYRLSAWIKQADDGSKFLSLAFSPRDERQAAQAKPAAAAAYAPKMNDDGIPF